ncbi:hypothetical protein K461DRAFT_158995 [Myriangium duriaei CBS 260.36]|uniref:Uncharacterized protein n=1 Tax=Myriangium duriaei CBS 260.36 TaxID=1168546 RepID=A0A9P4MJB9_9PEZI|nr:hypothetical protein K461DRAFT_158995 [Myriangium duriaei CBS 260.36]
MPPLPGEELLVTLFADVHYYLSPPASKPQHERFVRGSYVYLFYHGTQRRSRLEIANHAGTPDQDAIDGHLDNVAISHDKKQPNVATVVIDGMTTGPVPQHPTNSPSWRLLSYDLSHENKYMHRLHSADVYFWTSDDCSKFIDQCKRFLPEQHITISPPGPTSIRGSHYEHANAVHPLVQHLEQAAITDVYRPRASTSSTIHSNFGKSESTGRTSSRADSHTPASLPNPAPYNPATPGAPETFTHREKTPPPVDAAAGTGLLAAAAMEQPIIQSAVQQQHPVQVYSTTSASFPPPPQVAPQAEPHTPLTPNLFPSTTAAIPPPPFSPTQQQYATYAHDTLLQRSTPDYFQHAGPPSFAPPPQQHQHQQSSGTTPLASPAFSPYTSTAAYEAQSHQSPIHTQFYRPTEAELKHGHGHAGSHRGITQAMALGGTETHAPQKEETKSGRLEAKMGKVEGRVNKWFKKIDRVG